MQIQEFIKKYYFSVIVIALLFFALIVRYYHTKIGLPYLYYWDEPQTASTALHMMKSGDLNPHFFAYGTMMIYANLFVDILHYFSLMGHPPTAESYLTHIDEILINVDTGWKWTISHPSFYHWNRVLSVLLGVATVFVTFLVGRLLFNRWVGLIAAAFLAVLPFHVIRSTWVATDSPVALFVLLVVLFSLLFIKSQKLSYFILSLVFVGVAIATKYNSGLAMLIPFISLLWLTFISKEKVKTYMWFLVPTIPIAVFLMIMPYAIIDLPTFLRHVGGEVRHYKVLGQAGHTLSPGLGHLKFQILQFYSHIGFFNSIMIGLGVLGILFRPLFIFTLMMPFLYISYMIGTKVGFHRNFIQVYPFLALLFASGFYIVYKIIEQVRIRFAWQRAWITPIAVVSLALLFLVPQASTTYALAKMEKKARDSRTHAIGTINATQGFKKLVIAKELRMHKQDLRKLNLPYKIKPLLTIASKPSNDDTLYILPALITSYKWKKDKKKITAMRGFVTSIEPFIIKKVSKNDRGDKRNYVGITRLYHYSISPDILLVKNWRAKGAE